MSLVNELKERREAVANKLEDAYVSTGTLRAELDDLDRAIAALEPAPLTAEEIADVTEFVAEQEAASEQLASDHALPPAADDVVAEEAPELFEAQPVEEAPALTEAEPEQPVEGYAHVTNPEADQVVSAMSWYSPKEIAERHKFDPFALFKREKEDA